MENDGGSLLSGYLAGFTAESFIASLVVSAIGYVAFAYGKKQRRAPQFVTGLLLMVFPYFVTNVLYMGIIASGLVGLMWMVVRAGY